MVPYVTHLPFLSIRRPDLPGGSLLLRATNGLAAAGLPRADWRQSSSPTRDIGATEEEEKQEARGENEGRELYGSRCVRGTESYIWWRACCGWRWNACGRPSRPSRSSADAACAIASTLARHGFIDVCYTFAPHFHLSVGPPAALSAFGSLPWLGLARLSSAQPCRPPRGIRCRRALPHLA